MPDRDQTTLYKMRFILTVLLFGAVAAQDPGVQPGVQPAAPSAVTDGRLGFFDISVSYTSALVSTFLFVFGFILVIDLLLGKLQIVSLINGGRRGRSFLDPLIESLALPQLPTTTEVLETLNHLNEAIVKFENRDHPRSI